MGDRWTNVPEKYVEDSGDLLRCCATCLSFSVKAHAMLPISGKCFVDFDDGRVRYVGARGICPRYSEDEEMLEIQRESVGDDDG